MKTQGLPDLDMKDFSLEQHEIWKTATADWLANDFVNGCLKQVGFKQDCHDCGNVNVYVKIKVDAQGKITSMNEISANIDCGRRSETEKQTLKTCMMDSFQKINLPLPFRDRALSVRVGRSTRC